MQPSQTRQYPPLPPKNSNQQYQQSRIPIRQSSSIQSEGNLLSLRQTNSQSMQSINSSDSNTMQQQPNPNYSGGSSNSFMIHQLPSTPSFINQQYNQNYPNQQPNQNNQPSPSTPCFTNQPSNHDFKQQSPSITNFSRESSNSNFMQQPNQNYQQVSSNSNMMYQSPSAPNFSNQSSNSNFAQPQTNGNIPQQQANPNVPQLPINPNYPQQQQQQPLQQQTNSILSSQSSNSKIEMNKFAVIYNNATFMVDPIGLGKSSLKFRQLIQPYIENPEQMSELHLEVNGNSFTNRNMNNFLRLCQNLPTDVKNEEMKEICEIAKMFQADQIYTVGLNFIQKNLDPLFNVPDSKYEGNNYLSLQLNKSSNETQDADDSYFEDANNKSYQGDYHKINNTNQNEGDQENSGSSDNQDKSEDSEPHNLDDHSMLHDPVYSLNKAVRRTRSGSTNSIENINSEQVPKQEEENKESEQVDEYSNMDSIIYMVRVEYHAIKCPVFKFVREGKILYTAKQKYNDVYIAEGGDIHISKKANHVAHIYQDNVNNFNSINMKDTHFQLKYVNSGAPNHYSLQVTFPFKDKIVNWIPKPPKYDPTTEKYYLNFHGEYHHTPINSSKNIVLQNKQGNSTFIVRKMNPNVFEIECLPIIDPLVVFTIGLSDIIGPYDDGWSGVDYFL